MEKLLHYIWKYRLCGTQLISTAGSRIEVLDPGQSNTDAGPDFFNAKIKIDGHTWAGNIEIHTFSTDWYKHQHQHDEAYNSVILHVVEHANGEIKTHSGHYIPQCELKVAPYIKQNYKYLLSIDMDIPCFHFIKQVPPVQIHWMLDALLHERLERKTTHLFTYLQQQNGSWNDAFYILLARNMGFGLNTEPFEKLALATPLSIIRKHADNIFQIEALLFGQAGLLSGEAASNDQYVQELQREYHFLQHKYQLSPLNSSLFKNLRIRPESNPHIRIAQLSVLCQRLTGLFANILTTNQPEEMKIYFHISPSDYWQTHYYLGKSSAKKQKYIGERSLDNILINTVAPILFAYGIKNNLEEYTDKAIKLLSCVNAEQNSITRLFKSAGIATQSAYQSQALIQLKREYCEKRKCLFCRIGYRFLSSK